MRSLTRQVHQIRKQMLHEAKPLDNDMLYPPLCMEMTNTYARHATLTNYTLTN